MHRVVWVEGHPDYFAALSDHVSRFKGQEAHRLLVSDRDGERVVLRVASNTGSSTILEPSKSFSGHFPDIRFVGQLELTTERLDTYFGRHQNAVLGCDMLVLDVEGAELKALISLGALLNQFDAILCEVSVVRNFEGGPLLTEIDTFLAARGLVRRALWMGYSSGDAVYVRAQPTWRDGVRSRAGSTWLVVSYELGLLRLRRWALETIKRGVLRK
jgi:FkbM family methyltransferase